jgi:hypothetical protein
MKVLEEYIKTVAEARKNYDTINELLKSKKAEWEEQNAELISTVKESAVIMSEAEIQLREATVKIFNETGNKAPATGVNIREVTKYDYDPTLALKWAKSHDMALKLDDTAFKKIIKADAPDFVTVTTEPQATIATDLSEYLIGG